MSDEIDYEQMIIERLESLSQGQLALLNSIIATFQQPITAWCQSDSNVVSEDFLIAFGDLLKLHHTLSTEYLEKRLFEAAMERVYKALGIDAQRPKRGNQGHDITVDGVPWSLKTQGDEDISKNILWISKFMELGKRAWSDQLDELIGLRDRFLRHMEAYERIFQLRYFRRTPSDQNLAQHYYELVEIPKALLQESSNGQFQMMFDSTQVMKPGYCRVFDPEGKKKFQLYFDGGREGKLQIQGLRKALCTVHATWEF